MTSWIDELAHGMGIDPPSPPESERLLRASREVAHRVERRITPLSTFVLGMGLATRMAQGESREEAFDRVLGSLEDRLAQAAPDGADDAPPERD
jgi:hypothetical protein